MALPDPVADAELLMMAASMPRTVTDARTIAPPAKAQRPGLSPNTRRTQRGFRIGSMAVMSTASRAYMFDGGSIQNIWDSQLKYACKHKEQPSTRTGG